MGSSHPRGSLDRRLFGSIALNSLIVVAEFAGGILSGSLSLLSDAVHNLTDVTSLLIAWFARRVGRRPPSPRHTFGLRRAEVIAALVNSVLLLVAVTLIVREAVTRLGSPEPIHGEIMLPVAVVGLLGNLVSVVLLHGHARGGDLNVRSAFLHLVQDTVSSVVVVAVALFAEAETGPYLDAAASFLVAVFVLRAGWQVFWEATSILMEAVPKDVNIEELARACRSVGPVRGVHHVHVWETVGGDRLLTAHVKLSPMPLDEAECVLGDLRRLLSERFRIHHVTLEPEIRGCGDEALIGNHHGHLEPRA